MFYRVDIFEHLSAADIAVRTKQIGTVENTEPAEPKASENTYLADKKLDTDIANNIKYFKVLCNGSNNVIEILGR